VRLLLLAQLDHAAVVVEHIGGHERHHAPGQILVDEAHHRNVRQRGVLEQVVDAGADRHDQLQVRQLGQFARWRPPGQRVADTAAVAGIGPHPEIEARVGFAGRRSKALRAG
jgi:hypothetical protein